MKLLSLILICSLSLVCLAGNDKGNGGYGVRIQDKIYSLDLVLRGSSHNPYLSKNSQAKLFPEEKAILERILGQMDSQNPGRIQNVIHLVENKLAELRGRAEVLKAPFPLSLLMQELKYFKFIKMQTAECLLIDDDESPIKQKVQLAVRQDKTVRFCNGVDLLDEANFAGLILHEFFYGLSNHREATKALVGFLFSRDYELFDLVAQAELQGCLKDFFWLSPRRFPLSRLQIPLSREYESISVIENFPISDSFHSLLNIPEGLTACFAKLGQNSERSEVRDKHYVLWLQSKEIPCRKGSVSIDLRLGTPYFFGAEKDKLTFKQTVVGEIAPNTTQLLSLCSGDYEKTCELNLYQSSFLIRSQVKIAEYFSVPPDVVSRFVFNGDAGICMARGEEIERQNPPVYLWAVARDQVCHFPKDSKIKVLIFQAVRGASEDYRNSEFFGRVRNKLTTDKSNQQTEDLMIRWRLLKYNKIENKNEPVVLPEFQIDLNVGRMWVK